MDTHRAKAVFTELTSLPYQPPGRDEHHALTDQLELVAVAVGLKPAFLGGQSDPTDVLCRQIADVAPRLELHTLWGAGLTDMAVIKSVDWPGVDSAYVEFMLESDMPRLQSQQLSLWVYADASHEAIIRSCEWGERLSSDALGYPTCCTRHFMSRLAYKLELKLAAFRKEYGAQSTGDLVHLNRMGVGPSLRVKQTIEEINNELSALLRRSLKAFPYIHFTACPNCIDTPGSPAAQINTQMKQLAELLDPRFAQRFLDHVAWYEGRWAEAERLLEGKG